MAFEDKKDFEMYTLVPLTVIFELNEVMND
jgi:hypothetical protein